MIKSEFFLRNMVAIAICLAASATLFAQTNVDVYVGGSDNGKATVWKNGTPTHLTTTGEGYNDIFSVVVDKGNVYAAGSEYEEVSGQHFRKLWKNGAELYNFSDETEYAYVSSIAVSGSGVYTAGCGVVSGNTVGIVWKNGIVETVYDDASELRSIFIDGSDIYVAGTTNFGQASVWKNEDLLYTLSTEEGYGYAHSVVVYGGDVYTAGIEWIDGNVVKVWKNDEELYTLDTDVTGWDGIKLFISDGVIYVVAGITKAGGKAVAKLWIDGESENLSDSPNATWASTVFVSGSDVYAAGWDWDETQYNVMLWKNGTEIPLTVTGESWAYSVFVANNYTVSFAGDGISITPQLVADGCLATQPETPERTGYDFKGWFTDNGAFLNEWNFATDAVTQDTTLYAKWEETTGITNIEIAGIEIYPNPVKDVLRIENGELNINRIEITDLSGKVIYRFNGLRTQINVSALSLGIYFLKLETDKGTVTKKFVKE